MSDYVHLTNHFLSVQSTELGLNPDSLSHQLYDFRSDLTSVRLAPHFKNRGKSTHRLGCCEHYVR